MTTSWTSLLHGNFVRSFQSNLMGPVLYALFTFSALFGAVGAVKGFRLNLDHLIIRRSMIGLMIVFFGYSIIRFATAKNYAVPVENQFADYIGVRPAQ